MVDFENLKKPYLIGEIGINHNGNIQIAKKLIDATFACSWDCVKFQKKNPDVCIPENQKKIEKNTPWGKMTYLEYKHRMEFGKEEYDYIDRYCREKPIDWALSVWDIDSLEFSMQYKIPFIKIPSAYLTNIELLKRSAKTKLPIIVSTGMSTFEEIDTTVNVLGKNASQYILMHCNSSYPAKAEELNLKMIPVLKKRYGCVVGYSGHEYGLTATAIAVSLGAMVVERHITLDHNMWGTDHSSSVEIQGMDKLFKHINSVHKILGNGKKIIYESEKLVKDKLRAV